jgi:hypothetical protein
MKIIKTITIIVLVLMFPYFAHAQILYNGIGHIPEYAQVDWPAAGLLPEFNFQNPDHVFDVSLESGTASEKVNAALLQARSKCGVSIIYFPEGTYYLDETIELTHIDGNNITDYDLSSAKVIV